MLPAFTLPQVSCVFLQPQHCLVSLPRRSNCLMGLSPKWLLPLGKGMDGLKLPVQNDSTCLLDCNRRWPFQVNEYTALRRFGPYTSLSQLYSLFWAALSCAELWEQRPCVPGSRLAQACLVYHSGLNCLSYGRVFICITNGGWLIMWFLVGIRSPLELAQSLPTIYSLHMSQIFQFWFQIFYPTVSRSTLYACQTTCQFMVWEI